MRIERSRAQTNCRLASGLFAVGFDVTEKRQADGLLVPAPPGERVSPRQRERPDVGLVRRVGPVALILHFERIAFHPAGRPQARSHLVRESPDVEDRLGGADGFGEASLLLAPVDVGDFQLLARRGPPDAGRRNQRGWSRSRSPAWRPRSKTSEPSLEPVMRAS